MASPDRPASESENGKPTEARESIWSIPTKYKRWYFGLFSIQVLIATVWMVSEAIGDKTLASVPDGIASVWQGIAPMAITSAAFSLVLIETWAASMVIASWLEEAIEKRRQQQIKAAEDRARTEERQLWQDWNSRREAAAAAGEDFSEPPPGSSEDPAGAK